MMFCPVTDSVVFQIIHKELGLFQQKLEEEVKKDQQEKKENQETLKALKIEIKELAESQERYGRGCLAPCISKWAPWVNVKGTFNMIGIGVIDKCRFGCLYRCE